MNRVIVVGSANTDLAVRVENLPSKGETVMGRDLTFFFGGKGANQALAALRCGADVLLIARIGTDHYGQRLARHLKDSGLPAAGIAADDEHPAGLAFILVEPGGDNQITVVPGSNQHLSPADVRACADWFAPGSVLLTQLEIPMDTAAAALELAKSCAMTTILNPAPFAPLSRSILAATDILTPNQGEAVALCDSAEDIMQDPSQHLAPVLDLGPKEIIITLGQDGALRVTRKRQLHIPASPVRAVDTVGAGDAFNGALAAAMAHGCSMQNALRLAGAAGALTAATPGAQEALPSQEDIEVLAGVRFGSQGHGRDPG
ncbi:ribokinase [Desulfovermiculus halophilus]|jgi:ribokinase|uniref:ribokinase n=1 Tax=Desulfovermiculus halophilus TaxID=339722 RepID=UPI0006866F93|nr:ribokinase [Desulfovermiculus halophilus]